LSKSGCQEESGRDRLGDELDETRDEPAGQFIDAGWQNGKRSDATVPVFYFGHICPKSAVERLIARPAS
jgi:hypothetical protein